MTPITQEYLQHIQDFHGHMCPGLAIGIQASRIALERIGPHSKDEEVVAVVETDMCAVDAVQFMTGCTFGKGNLVHRDFGKNAFTFIRRSDNKAVRVMTKPTSWGGSDNEHRDLFAKLRSGEATPEERTRFQDLHLAKSERILAAPAEELFEVTESVAAPPKRARIHNSTACASCGEQTMETRIRRFGGKDLCIPCFESYETR